MKITGVSMERDVTNNYYEALKKIGVTTSRMINCLNEVDYIGGKFTYGNRLYNPLTNCKNHNLTPHIIIGQEPRWTPTLANYKDFDWTLWREYVTDVLTEVCIRQGFTTTIWEVGNEMMHGRRAAWLNPEGYDLIGEGNAWTTEVYDSYIKLYWETALAVMAFEIEHPELNIKLGGWASGAHPIVQKFAQQTRKVKRDFIGMHMYTKGLSTDTIRGAVEKAKMYDTVKVLITEFGYDAHSKATNDTKTEFESTKMFLDLAESWGIDEVYALVAIAWEHDKQQSIWKTDGLSLTPQGLAMAEQAL